MDVEGAQRVKYVSKLLIAHKALLRMCINHMLHFFRLLGTFIDLGALFRHVESPFVLLLKLFQSLSILFLDGGKTTGLLLSQRAFLLLHQIGGPFLRRLHA
jgi:hypothetical protein